jgi:chromosome partitioning protein
MSLSTARPRSPGSPGPPKAHNAFTASDRVLIPVAPGYFELDSIVQISKTVQEVREYFNPQIGLAGFLYTMSDPTMAYGPPEANNAKTSLRILRQTYTDAVLKTIIPRNTDIRDAHFHRQDIFTYAPLSKSAQAYQRLLVELFHP